MTYITRILIAMFALISIGPLNAQTIKPFTPSIVHSGDLKTPGGATFQSQNRLITQTKHGCYASYLYKQDTDNPLKYRAGLWFSPTCEQSWSLIDSFGAYNGGPPSVIADRTGDIYWLIADDNSMLIIRKYACGVDPICLDRTQRIWPGYSTGGKVTAAYSEHCNRLFVFSWAPVDKMFLSFDTDMNLINAQSLVQSGPVSYIQYPWIEISQDIILAGWVTMPTATTVPNYDGIRYMLNNSCGGAGNWYTPHSGASATPPFIADVTGPSSSLRAGFTPSADSVWPDAITLTNRLNVHVSYASPNGPSPTTQTEFAFHNMGASYYRLYMHDNLMQGSSTAKVGGASLTIQSLRGSSGCYFKGDDNSLYLVGVSKELDTNGKNWINALKSIDDGATWVDFAQSTNTFNVFALNCARQGIETSPGVWLNGNAIVGIFTDLITPGLAYPQQVQSFRIPIN